MKPSSDTDMVSNGIPTNRFETRVNFRYLSFFFTNIASVFIKSSWIQI